MSQNSLLNTDDILYLSNGDKIILNDQQIKAISHIKQFMKSTSKMFVLSGHAGTGKTTVIKKILDEYKGRAVVSASTNKAVRVASESTMFDGVTIHALLGLQPDVSLDDFNPNEPQFNQIKPSTISDYNLIIIDEASMINADLFQLISAEVGVSTRTKIVFMGDRAQIPPISEEISAVFGIDTIYHSELTTLVRQSEENPLIKTYNILRDNIINDAYNVPATTDINADGDGLLVAETKEEFRDNLIKAFTSDEYKEDLNYAKLIAWRNITVKQSNKIIRDVIFGSDANVVKKNDVLMGYRTVQSSKHGQFLINNCMDYRVASVSRRQKNKDGIYGYTTRILEKSKIFKGYDEKKIFIVDHSDFENLHNYAERHDDLVEMSRADRKKWKSYYIFRRNNLLMVNIDGYKCGRPRIKSKQISKDLDYGYAVTCHKVQGSTYSKVFVLAKDISLNKNYKERNQMLYVALTRPRKLAVVLL